VIALTFLHTASSRVLGLVRFSCRKETGLAIEILMLRHEVAVLRHQVHCPAMQSAHRTLLAGL
jgi:hypothetical protein